MAAPTDALPMTADIPPNQTIYIRNINEKIKQDELKKSLYQAFSQFGQILDIVALNNVRMRGQAFLVFKDIASATNAIRTMQGFPFLGKPMQLQYAKSKSDAVAKLDGSFKPREKKIVEKRKPEEGQKKPEKKPKTDAPRVARPAAPAAPEVQLPNKILFVEQLPEQTTDDMLKALFGQYPGFKEVRLIAGKGVAFVEFENEMMATSALSGLQGFMLSPEHLLKLSFAKR
eukprot:GILJ01003267.1.p1 GENE.GILJ01003267.1~~GILJ01003267.1.p1  ORF type:complete len:245 (-),score=51.50 GILJ01003267.1:142-831(-)